MPSVSIGRRPQRLVGNQTPAHPYYRTSQHPVPIQIQIGNQDILDRTMAERKGRYYMFGKKKEAAPPVEEKKEKPTPAFLRPDYPYQAVGEALTVDQLQPGVFYEIKCHQCEMSIRSQGQNIKSTYERLKSTGCIGCGNKDLVIKRVDMSKAPATTAATTPIST